MKDTKTVLPTNNTGGNGENRNGFHHKSKTQENGNEESTTSTTVPNGLDSEELVGGCCVCSDDQGFANNALVYCDGKDCTVACHTACYGIVSIPDGDWYCGRCEAGDIRAPCRLCPTIEGAMKRTSDAGWAHVVCALYIPEVSFGDDTTMEPIILSKIPSTRFGQECSICIQNGRSKLIATSGACCACTVKNCSQVFHVTCAQANGLLCEDVRKNNCQYPIYCEQHRPKFSKFIRQIAPFQYSPHAIPSNEQMKKQLRSKEKENPSQLSDFIAAAAADAETDMPASSLDDSNNQTNTSDEHPTPVPRTFHGIDTLQRKSSSNTNSSVSSTSSSTVSPLAQQKSHSRSSSSSSSTNSSLQKKAKINDEMNNNNQSLSDLSQFVQLNKEERSFVPPPPPPSSTNQADTKEGAAVVTKPGSSTIESKETASVGTKSSKSNCDQQSSLNSIEEKPLASRCTISSSSDTNSKSSIKQRPSTDGSSSPTKSNPIKKPSLTKAKDGDADEDYELSKKRKLSIKLNKDGQPRKKRQHSVEGASRPVGRPPSSKKTSSAQQVTNGIKRPLSKPSSTTNTSNMKQQKVNDTLINIHKKSTDNENETEMKTHSRSTHYYPCDHFGNQINSDAFKQQGHSADQVQPIDKNEDLSCQRVSSSSTTTAAAAARIDFYPRRPLQAALAQSSATEQQQQRTFPPQTLEEFLEQEWESSSDFLLQQTMPHDVSSLLSCLYQFKSENAALQKKFDELKHRRDSLRVTNTNLRRRLSEILPVTETVPPPPTVTSATTTVTQISPTLLLPPPPLATASLLPPAPSSLSTLPLPTAALPVVPPSPRKEQQHLKQQKLLAELELQQQLQHQKAISPTRRRLSTNTSNQSTDSSQSTIRKSKSPRHPNALTHQSILENQLRQSANTNPNSTKKSSTTTTTTAATTTIPSAKKLPSTEMELVTHHPSTSTHSTVLSTTAPSTSTYESNDATATAAAAFTLAKNGRAPANAGLSLELLTHILAASGNPIGPQLFAPTWNISNFGFANFPGANPLSVSDESILRSYAPPTHSSLEQQPQSQSSTKPQP
ncbi:unnamed protein product [Adineta ricciae]|uniref:Protein AF-10 n=1 Tax=Adineta ricciae TaxID=249248 RepID=A0A816BJS7_ADIRI|nr:unnamed protein product [Adineta ricciae]